MELSAAPAASVALLEDSAVNIEEWLAAEVETVSSMAMRQSAPSGTQRSRSVSGSRPPSTRSFTSRCAPTRATATMRCRPPRAPSS